MSVSFPDYFGIYYARRRFRQDGATRSVIAMLDEVGPIG
jgi:hypothetical protein